MLFDSKIYIRIGVGGVEIQLHSLFFPVLLFELLDALFDYDFG